MSLTFFPPPSTTTIFNLRTNFSNPKTTLFNSNKIPSLPTKIPKFHQLYPSKTLNLICNNSQNPNPNFDDFNEESSKLSPWEGALMYKRDPKVTHLEYCTTLERLGLGKYSTEVSKTRASIMGLRVTKAVKDYPLGTPVLVSVDVCRKKYKLRLDGIIRTVLSLRCNRCGEPAAECVFSNFTLLLTEEAIEEEDVINMGTLFGKNKQNTFINTGEDAYDDDDLIDMDDRLYFPPEQNEVDISKNIRDMVHVEITINSVCNPGCKGLCLRCGANLNTSKCRCKKQEKEKYSGPLRNLRNQIQKK
ncbi:hypothetical protein AQUCO_05700022v1 [Aquilegia coerulea]|uniref:Uncharacterized protein n=1 Tax=Aquilegia coerulea TaxID=218851 RepID=A0A2G5CFG0_AQUCA|nr:hypothetical protein AQUCO_05700022v1 [Aquilegia coerulea]